MMIIIILFYFFEEGEREREMWNILAFLAVVAVELAVFFLIVGLEVECR